MATGAARVWKGASGMTVLYAVTSNVAAPMPAKPKV